MTPGPRTPLATPMADLSARYVVACFLTGLLTYLLSYVCTYLLTNLKPRLHLGNMFLVYRQQNCCQFVARLLLDTKGYKSTVT